MSEEFAIGSKVRVVALPPYIKTAETYAHVAPSRSYSHRGRRYRS